MGHVRGVRRYRSAHRALVTQMPGERAGAHDGDAGDALCPQFVVQAAQRPPAGGDPRRLTDHVARDPDPPRLVIFVVDPVLPMCGAVIATICLWYDGSVRVSW